MSNKGLYTDTELIDYYNATNSVYKTAALIGITHGSVHRRLQKLGIAMNGNGRPWTDEDDITIINFYNSGFKCGDGTLNRLALELGRTKHLICRKAKELCLTNRGRVHSEENCIAIGKRASAWIKRNGHPRGALGMKHSDKTKKIVSKASIARWERATDEQRHMRNLKAMKTREKNGTLYKERKNVSWKQGWREIGGIKKYYRSRWEANYARYLEWLKQHGHIKKWEHEPETFWFDGVRRGCVSYLPDFRVTDNTGDIAYHEVKGWMDDRSRIKLKRMKKYHPKVVLILIQQKQYNEIKNKLGRTIPGWET